MDHLPEVVQAVTASVGVLTAAISAVVLRVKMRAAKEMKQIDVSAEWQAQMLSRISLVEQELQSERKRGDALEEDVFKWRQQASELEWELRASRAERHDMTSRIDELASENVVLKKQNASLASELRELNSQIRAGHPPLTLPPRLPPKAK